MDPKTTTDGQVQIPQEIRGFLDNLLTEAGMTNLDEQTHEDMIMELYKRLDHYIVTTVVANLPNENLEEFMKMNQEGKPQAEIQQFLQEKIPNSQDVFAKAFTDFRDLYLGNKVTANSQ
jgi:hypothetical protein